MTYENLVARMIQRINDNYPDVDVREGSMVFNSIAAAALELAEAYVELDNVRNESFVATATREYILAGCDQVGIDVAIFNATNGFFKGVFNIPIPEYSRWNMGPHNYLVIDRLEDEEEYENYFIYRLQCETAGSEPNALFGNLTPIDDINGDLTRAELVSCLIEGEDETSDEDIREYYFNHVRGLAIDGNVAQYEEWCTEYPGIGNYKIFPLWNGDNTVKVSILSSTNHKASDELIAEFQEYIDPNVTGMGDGVAPIGAFVTITTATEVPLTISATIVLKDGYSDTSTINDKVEEYLSDIAYETSAVSYMKLGSYIMNAEGVDFITNLLLNGGTDDLTLGEEEIATLGITTWTVSE